MADISALIEYYKNLLIIQYSGPDQPKAQAEIDLLATTALASGIILDIQDAYNIFNVFNEWDQSGRTWDDGGFWDDERGLAVGKQLDVIGKYVGVDRFYSELVLENYFSFITYDEVSALPDSPPRFGLSDYTTFMDFSYNGTLNYSDLIAVGNSLTDTNFRVLIQLAIIKNNSNFSHKQIDDAIFNFFGGTIRPESSGNMLMAYFISNIVSPLVKAIVSKKLLPKPMGVGLAVVSNVTGPMFAFTDYSGYQSPYGYGFSDYNNYATLPGQMLTYDQITRG